MTLTAGALSSSFVGATTASLVSAAATSGTSPYTYQWYRSTTTGFTPGGGNILSGATALTLADSGLIPNTPYFYKVIATDSVAATATSSQLAVVTTGAVLSPNQFAQSSIAGTVDLRFAPFTVAVQIDASQVGSIYAGAPVKIVAQSAANAVPKVVACSASTDECYGFLNYDIKTIAFQAGYRAEVSMTGNVIYLYATGAITQGSQVQLDVTNNGVAQLVGSSGANVVGWAFDGAAAMGSLIRVVLRTPSFLFA